MALEFNVLAATEAGGRRGELRLPHRAVQTPVFMPVGTAGTVKAVPQDVLETLGAELILGNTYHLYLRPGHEAIRRMGGLHRFMSWPRALLTDSGGFQVFSLSGMRRVTDEGVRFRSHLDGSSHFFTPEHSMDVQIALGADVCMAFDECTEYPAERSRAEESLRLTMAWARRSLDHFRAHCDEVVWSGAPGPGSPRTGFCPWGGGPSHSGTWEGGVPQAEDPRGQALVRGVEVPRTWGSGNEPRTQSLFGIVQGGTFRDLRRESAERLVEMDFDGYAIGGLSVGEPRALTQETIAEVLPLLPAGKPRYLMGVGYPDEIEQYARMGVDMMDCVLPTRAARHGLLFTSEGRLNIKGKRYAEDESPPDPACTCVVCRRYSRAYLRHLMQAGEPLSGTLNTIHNLAYYLGIMERVRKSLAGERS
ncbi:MAG: tRNA guanosine(34) transglycosylase Tgt [Terracidiphilus sp.]